MLALLPAHCHCGAHKDLGGYAGLVFAGGTYITGWDPRQKGNGPSAIPAFKVKYKGVDGVGDDAFVQSMIPAASFEGSGPNQLLTGLFNGSTSSLKDSYPR